MLSPSTGMVEVPTSRSSPVSLVRQEVHGPRGGVHLPRLGVDDLLLRLKGAPGFALVVDADQPVPKLKGAASACRRQRPVHDELPLAVNGAAEVEFWGAGDGVDGVTGVELDDLLVGQFESCGRALGRSHVDEGFPRSYAE